VKLAKVEKYAFYILVMTFDNICMKATNQGILNCSLVMSSEEFPSGAESYFILIMCHSVFQIKSFYTVFT